MKPGRVLVLMTVAGMFIWLLFVWFFLSQLSDDSQKNGQIGDTFGMLNSLFSAFGVIGVSYTLFLTLRANKKQDIDKRIDRFESTFFQMLQAQREIVGEFDLKKENDAGERVVYNKGRECFRDIYNRRFKDQLCTKVNRWHFTYHEEEKQKARDLIANKLSLKEVIEVYEKDLFKTYQDDLGHYYTHLYRIVRLVHITPHINKSEYLGILRAQLSAHEYLNLFYNCLTSRGEKFKPLIEEYGLFRQLDYEKLINGKSDKESENSYKSTAFRNNRTS
jgi:hypothetical protein